MTSPRLLVWFCPENKAHRSASIHTRTVYSDYRERGWYSFAFNALRIRSEQSWFHAYIGDSCMAQMSFVGSETQDNERSLSDIAWGLAIGAIEDGRIEL